MTKFRFPLPDPPPWAELIPVSAVEVDYYADADCTVPLDRDTDGALLVPASGKFWVARKMDDMLRLLYDLREAS